MKNLLRCMLAIMLLSMASSGMASWFNNDGWGGNNWNPYDEWDPRYWMEEMEDVFDDDDDYYGGPYGPYGYGPYGGYPGYGYGGYGPGYGYGPGPGYGYGPGPGYGYGPYGY